MTMVAARIILAYFTSWSIYRRAYFVSDIPGDKLSHINYAFANIGSDGRIVLDDSYADVEKTFTGDKWDQSLRGNFNQLIKLKEKYSHLRTLISVGGWTRSGKFSDIAVTDQSRSTFAKSCVEFVKKYSFDGVDLDWEYPVSGGLPGNSRRPEDKQNYVLLLKELRLQLDSVPNKKYLLTVATGAGAERIADMNLSDMIKYLDWINIMTYDFHGGWESQTGHHAPLYKNNDERRSDTAPLFIKSKYNCDAAIQAYIAAGVPSNKIIMGLPLNGRGWQGVTDKDLNGFSQTASSQLPKGTWVNGVFDYDDIKKSYIPSNQRYWDDQSKVPFLFNLSTGLWISYVDKESINFKNDYIKQKRLGGAFFWELSSDRQAELIGATFNALSKGIQSTTTNRPYSTAAPTNKISLWAAEVQYKVDQRVIYRGKIYRCIKTHKSAPKTTPALEGSLWYLETAPTTKAKVKATTESPKQGDSSQWRTFDSYSVGDQVTYQGKIYRCRQAHTSLSDWLPPIVPALWLEV